jgi:hypothetical protein
MAWLFSKRCKQALNDGKIRVSIPTTVRTRLWKALREFNESWWETDEDTGSYQTTTLREIYGLIEAELGIKELLAFPPEGGNCKPSDIEGFILRGNYPPYLLDTLELFHDTLREKKDQFQNRVNEIMEESHLSWRMSNGKIFPVDSSYIDEEITRNASALLKAAKFSGALEEYERARVDLTNSDYEGTIQNAYLAVESTIKEILGIQKAKQGTLFSSLIDSGLVPEYYDGFLKAFEENILRCVAKMRNEELGVGHGKGPSGNVVPQELAELAVHFSGVLINFLVKQHTKQKSV